MNKKDYIITPYYTISSCRNREYASKLISETTKIANNKNVNIYAIVGIKMMHQKESC